MSTLTKTNKPAVPCRSRSAVKTLLVVPRRTPPAPPCSAMEAATALARPIPGFDVARVIHAAAARDL